jgi:8-oxo-dGTP diphosphatase / 2-hydroxy-dATP diphosphatase
MKVLLTLCYIHQPPRILLGLKKRGFGKDRWNGFGGKLKDGETLLAAAKREFLEEAGMTVDDLVEYGVVTFRFQNTEDIFEVHVFKANNYSGEPQESEEMKPQWFEVNKIPYAKMWSSDKHWFPLLLQGKKFFGNFLFDGNDEVIEFTLNEKNN